MSDSKDNSEKKEKNSSSQSRDNDNSVLSSEKDKRKARIPKFEKKDMYRIKYNF